MSEKKDVKPGPNGGVVKDVAKKDPAGKEVAPKIGQEKNGKTTIADQVVAKIAGLAVHKIEGVHDVGGAFSRALGSARDLVGANENIKLGISVEVGEEQAAVDLTIVTEYPYPVYEVADKVRKHIIDGIQDIAGLEVTEVNIEVADVYIPELDDKDDEEEDDKKDEPKKSERVK